MRRKTPLVTGETYHIYTKSIYRFVIFPTEREYQRMLNLLSYHQADYPKPKFSSFLKSASVKKYGFDKALNLLHPRGGTGWVDILAYCLMPTHIHLILKQAQDNGIRHFMGRVLDSYSLFFNKLHNRKGPLWQERFGASLIRSPEQLNAKIAYVYENPVKDLGYLDPAHWPYSSYPRGGGG